MKITITFVIAVLALPSLAAEVSDVADNASGQHFGGPSSVAGQVSSDREKRKLPVFEDLFNLQAFYDFKDSR